MNLKFGAAIGMVAAIALSSAPSPTLAQAAQQSTYTTMLTEKHPSPSSSGYTGSLRLTIASDGRVSGYYIPDDQADFIPVVGGMTNGALWLSVGDAGRLQIDATLGQDGSMVGTATELSADVADSGSFGPPITYEFVAKQSSLR
jgi:hypothetical protein